MPDVFPNLSVTTSPVTSATYSEQGVTVPAVRASRNKSHSCCRHILYLPISQNENEGDTQCPQGIKLDFSLSTPFSVVLCVFFCLNTLHSFFSLSIFLFSEPLCSLATQIGIPESEWKSPNQQLWYYSRQGSAGNSFSTVPCSLLHEMCSISTWEELLPCVILWSRNWLGHRGRMEARGIVLLLNSLLKRVIYLHCVMGFRPGPFGLIWS